MQNIKYQQTSKGMRINIIILGLVYLIAFSGCNSISPKEKDLEAIKKLEEQVFSNKISKLDPKLGNELMGLYDDFSSKYVQDSLAPKYLFKAGEVAMSLNLGNKAISYFTKLQQQFPENRKAPHSLFLQAFIFETQMNNLPAAKQKYTEFIDKYPKHELVKDAIASIDLLGKTPEEIIKNFEEKNKAAQK